MGIGTRRLVRCYRFRIGASIDFWHTVLAPKASSRGDPQVARIVHCDTFVAAAARAGEALKGWAEVYHISSSITDEWHWRNPCLLKWANNWQVQNCPLPKIAYTPKNLLITNILNLCSSNKIKWMNLHLASRTLKNDVTNYYQSQARLSC